MLFNLNLDQANPEAAQPSDKKLVWYLVVHLLWNWFQSSYLFVSYNYGMAEYSPSQGNKRRLKLNPIRRSSMPKTSITLTSAWYIIYLCGVCVNSFPIYPPPVLSQSVYQTDWLLKGSNTWISNFLIVDVSKKPSTLRYHIVFFDVVIFLTDSNKYSIHKSLPEDA